MLFRGIAAVAETQFRVFDADSCAFRDRACNERITADHRILANDSIAAEYGSSGVDSNVVLDSRVTADAF